MAASTLLLFVVLLGATTAVPPPQIPLDRGHGLLAGNAVPSSPGRRPLHGRFLHVTDFHPDGFYQVYSSTAEEAACHRGHGPAGIYGAETSECDSPMALINKTMEWIGEHLKDKIDFVLWTGDSARHDNDEELPRNAEQVIGFNEFMVRKMFEVFGKHNGDENDEDPNNDYIIPIVPTIGNNDILPHNVMMKGPNTWTRTYTRLWRQFIPEYQKHLFEQGAWFHVEVVPNKLAVFSMNTLYFAKNNGAADGCASPEEPGYQQFEWLRVQLQLMRERGVKAILMGHQPPIRQEAKELWEETCWQKYTLWLRQYRDVIMGSMYGHFNYDHFVLQDFEDLDKDTKHGRMDGVKPSDQLESDDQVHVETSSDYWLQLRETWSKLPKPPKSLQMSDVGANDESLVHGETALSKKEKKQRKKYFKRMGGEYAERFAASFISASVVPNLFPTLRVYEYNITGLDQTHFLPSDAKHFDRQLEQWAEPPSDTVTDRPHKFVIPDGPSKSAPPGPAYSPQPLSLLGFKQYYANITYINNDFHGNGSDFGTGEEDDEVNGLKWHEGKHKGETPHDKDYDPRPREFRFKVLYDTRNDPVYRLPDLTMPRIVDLARRIGAFEPEDDGEPVPWPGYENIEDDDEEDDDLLEAYKLKSMKKDGKKKKKHAGKVGKHTKRNAPWYTFMRRAFVDTLPPEEIQNEYGH